MVFLFCSSIRTDPLSNVLDSRLTMLRTIEGGNAGKVKKETAEIVSEWVTVYRDERCGYSGDAKGSARDLVRATRG